MSAPTRRNRHHGLMAGRMPRRADIVLDDHLPDGHILLHPRSGDYFRVDGVAAAVWELCDGTRDEEAIVAAVQARFDAPGEQVEPDVARFLDTCVAAGLITL